MSWLKEHSDTLWKIGILLFAIISFGLTMEFKVEAVEGRQQKHINDYEDYRYREVPDTYMRKDVMQQVLIRLDRIEQKIDERNQ